MSEWDESVRHQLMVEGYKENEVNEVLLVIPFLLKGFVDDINSLNVPKLNELTWSKAKRAIEVIKKHQIGIGNRAVKDFMSRMKQFSGSEYKFQSASVDNNGGEASPTKSNSAVFAFAEDTPTSIDGSTIADFAPFWVLAHADRIANTLRRGWSEGTPNQELIGLVRGARSRRYKNGLLGSVLARDVGYSVKNIIQHVSTTARVFAALGGVALPQNQTLAPVHPNCRSTIAPVLKNSEEPTRQTYYSWLKKQPASFQNEVLGQKRGKLFRKDGMTADRFANLNLNRYFRQRTLDELESVLPETIKP